VLFKSSETGGEFSATEPGYSQGPDPFLTQLAAIPTETILPVQVLRATRPNRGNNIHGKGAKSSKTRRLQILLSIQLIQIQWRYFARHERSKHTNMARSLGLINKSQGELNFSEERRGAIGHILHDDTLDTTENGALKALLH